MVDVLSPMWAGLPPDRRVALGCKWVDHSLRGLLPVAFDRGGHPGVGAVLRTLPCIDSLDALRFAHDQLRAMKTPDEPVEALAAFFSLAASLKQLVEGFEIYECCFLAVMTSRFIYGDDRVVHSMAADLTGAPQ